MRFQWLIDASGQSGLLPRRYLESRRFVEALRNLAMWSYWRGAKLPRGQIAGPILVEAVPLGWFWGIPLSGGILSVGFVGHRDDLRPLIASRGTDGAYQFLLESARGLREMLAEATCVDVVRTQTDYSHLSDTLAGPGFMIVGDAAGFIDPLLSSGVHLAMTSALLSAATTVSLLNGDVAEADAIEFYDDSVRENYSRWLLLVAALYHRGGSKGALARAAGQLAASAAQGLEPRFPEAISSAVSGMIDLAAIASPRRDGVEAELSAYGDALLTEFLAHGKKQLIPIRLLDGFDSYGLRRSVHGLCVKTSPIGLRSEMAAAT
jgi:hypothetical protein